MGMCLPVSASCRSRTRGGTYATALTYVPASATQPPYCPLNHFPYSRTICSKRFFGAFPVMDNLGL